MASLVFQRVFAASQRLFSLLGSFIRNGPGRKLKKDFKDQTSETRGVCTCSAALHTHWLQCTAWLPQVGLGPAVFGIVSSGTANGVGKPKEVCEQRGSGEIGSNFHRAPPPPSTSAHRYILITATHRSHFANLQRTRDSSPQGEGWQSYADLSCSKPVLCYGEQLCLHCPLCSVLLFEDCLPVSRLMHRKDWLVCLSLRMSLRWL